MNSRRALVALKWARWQKPRPICQRILFSARPWRMALAALLFLVTTSVCLPATTSITLAWQPNQDPSIVGYNVYTGLRTDQYNSVTDVGNVTNAVISDMEEGRTYYFAVTAYDDLGLESLPSAEIVYAVPYASNVVKFAASPVTIQPKGQLSVNVSGPFGRTAVLLSSTNMANWNPIATNVFASTNLSIRVMDPPGGNKMRFFRIMLQ